MSSGHYNWTHNCGIFLIITFHSYMFIRFGFTESGDREILNFSLPLPFTPQVPVPSLEFSATWYFCYCKIL